MRNLKIPWTYITMQKAEFTAVLKKLFNSLKFQQGAVVAPIINNSSCNTSHFRCHLNKSSQCFHGFIG